MMRLLAFNTPGFYEIVALGVIALLIFGPDRLPGMARNTGRMIARFKREASTTLEELKRTAEVEELKGVADELRSTGRELASTGRELRSTGDEVAQAAAVTGSLAAGGAANSADSARPRPGSEADIPAPFDPDAT